MFEHFRRPLRFPILALLVFAMFSVTSASYAQTSFEPDWARAFVRAAIAVRHVSEDWQERIYSAKSEVEAERIREQANLAMRKVIRETDGISVDTYRSIFYAAKRDAELAAYLIDLLEREVAEAAR